MFITSIEKSETNPSMARVCVDEKIDFFLPKKRIDALDLSVGKFVEKESLDYILKYEVYAAAKNSAVKFLSLKLRTAFEIRDKLHELGYDSDTAEKVINDLKDIDYIDDYKYAVKYIAEKSKLKPKSAKLLFMELSYKGVPDDVISKAAEEFDLDDIQVALELLKKRYSKYDEFDEQLIRKMKAFLANRGFSFNQISKAISEFIPYD